MATHLLKEKPYRWTFIIGFIVFANLHGVILDHWLNMDTMISVTDSLIHNVFLFVAVAAITQMQAYYRPVKAKYVYVAVLTFVVSAIWTLLVIFSLKAIFHEHTDYIQWLSDTVPVRFALGWTMISGAGFISFFMYEMEEQREALARKEAAEKLAKEAELYKLRQQLQPHFLFNSLNNIYSLVYQGSSQSLAAIAGLSDLLRYMLYDATEKVPLEKEIDYIRKYIELQKLRFEGPVNVSMQVTGATTGTLIPPLLLVPFVENAFKHGDFAGQEGLALTVHCTRQKTWFYCHNKKGNQQKDASGGIGLDNVKRRLALLYPGRHHITVDNTPDHFTVNLELLHE